MPQITHDNHFVPQSYLKQWSEDGIHVWSYRILVSHENVPEWDYRPIRGIAYQRNLYTSYLDGEEVDDFEKWLEEEFENPAQESINKVLKESSLSPLDWERLARYLGAQDVRTPLSYLESMERWRATFPNLLEETLENSVRQFEQNHGRGKNISHSSPKETRFFKKAIKIHILPPSKPETEEAFVGAEIVAGRDLWLAKQKLLLTETVKALQNHKWSIVHPAQGYQWFTSDHPVVKLNYYGEGKYDLKGGWGNKGGNILFPISPRHLLFTQIGDELPDQLHITAKQTRSFQSYIAERSFRWIFSREPLKLITKLRPRNINPEFFRQETQQWKKWHEQQSQDENNKTV